METLIIKPRNKKELLFLKQFLDVASMDYEVNKGIKRKEIKNPILIKRIEHTRKNITQNTIAINPDNLWQSIL